VYGNWNCADSRIAQAESEAITAAISRAGNNRYTIDNSIADKNGVIAVCGENSSYGYVDKYIDVTVQISDTVKTNFLQVFYGGKMRNQVQAITACGRARHWPSSRRGSFETMQTARATKMASSSAAAAKWTSTAAGCGRTAAWLVTALNTM